MSHFTVLVIGDNVKQQLAPYQENNMGDCPKEYLEFEDVEEEYREEYENGGVEKIVMPDGRLIYPWDRAFDFPVDGQFDIKKIIPEHLERWFVPFNVLFPTFDEFVQGWHGFSGRDPETGKYGSWDNPNQKWDWYQVGGRWSGHFKLKPGRDGGVGETAFMCALCPEGHADTALKGDIDFDGMRDEAGEKAGLLWDKAVAAMAGSLDEYASWDHVREIECNGNIEEARSRYNSQEAVTLLRKVEDLGFFASPKDFQCTREEYVQCARDKAYTTFAVLKDGKWYEKGNMGWWGLVSDQKEQGDWNQEFSTLIDSLDDGVRLTVVDCHI